MAEEVKPATVEVKQELCKNTSGKYKWFVSILIILLVLVIGYLVWKGRDMIKKSKEIGLVSLNGYWHVYADRYLLIDESLVQIVDITADKGIVELFKIPDANIKIVDTSISAHMFEIDNYTASVNKLDINGKLQMLIIPSIGLMQFVIKEMDISEKLVKDNVMTLTTIME